MNNFDLYFGNMTYFWQILLILHYFLSNRTNFELFFDKYD